MVYDQTVHLVSRMLKFAGERHHVIANNIANVNTPGFNRLELDFEAQLAKAVRSGDIAQVEQIESTLVRDTESVARPDGNNVNLAQEMNDLMSNGIYTNLLTRVMSSRLSTLRNAIR